MDRTSESNIEELIAQKKWMNLRSLVTDWQAPEIADLLLSVQKSDRVLLFRVLPRTMSTEVFAHLNADLQVSLVKELTDEELKSSTRIAPVVNESQWVVFVGVFPVFDFSITAPAISTVTSKRPDKLLFSYIIPFLVPSARLELSLPKGQGF